MTASGGGGDHIVHSEPLRLTSSPTSSPLTSNPNVPQRSPCPPIPAIVHCNRKVTDYETPRALLCYSTPAPQQGNNLTPTLTVVMLRDVDTIDPSERTQTPSRTPGPPSPLADLSTPLSSVPRTSSLPPPGPRPTSLPPLGPGPPAGGLQPQDADSHEAFALKVIPRDSAAARGARAPDPTVLVLRVFGEG